MSRPNYRAKVGINYGKKNTRVEPGELLPADCPASVIRTLVEQDAIEPAPAPQESERKE